MSFWQRPWVAPALFGALLASAATNLLQWREPGRGQQAPTLAQIGLSADQIQEARSCCAGCCSERVQLDVDVAAKEAELQRLLAAEPLDREAVASVAKELGALHARAVENSVQAILLVRDVLTPEQLEALRACCAR